MYLGDTESPGLMASGHLLLPMRLLPAYLGSGSSAGSSVGLSRLLLSWAPHLCSHVVIPELQIIMKIVLINDGWGAAVCQVLCKDIRRALSQDDHVSPGRFHPIPVWEMRKRG